MAEELRDCRLEWVEESRLRNLRYREILSEGDREGLIVLINTISEYTAELIRQNKKVGSTEDNAIRRAKAMLFEEFAMTTDIRSIDEIEAVLRGEKILASKEFSVPLF